MVPGNFTDKDYYFRRVVEGNKTRRILHVDVTKKKGKAQVLHPADFGL
jgi:cytolysin-activating lysine-acyltransferase